MPVLMPGESHGQKNLGGYSPWGHKESDMTERALTHTHTHTHIPRASHYKYYSLISSVYLAFYILSLFLYFAVLT